MDEPHETPEDPEEAGRKIRATARDPRMNIFLTEHAKEKMAERRLPMPEVLWALRHGDINTPPRLSTRKGFFKYRMDCLTPGSDVRPIGVVVVPDFVNLCLKILSVMWVDDDSTPDGTVR